MQSQTQTFLRVLPNENNIIENYSIMPLTTRTVAKGIPPRVHSVPNKPVMPKSRAKQSNSTKKKQKKRSKKRAASDDESEENEDSSPSDDSVVKAKKKKHGKRRRIEELESDASDLLEVVDNDVEPPVCDVEEVDGSKDPSGEEQEVSTDHLS